MKDRVKKKPATGKLTTYMVILGLVAGCGRSPQLGENDTEILATLTANCGACTTVDNVVVDFMAMTGTPGDFITISKTGSGNGTFVEKKYTSGVSGSVTFGPLAAGSYEARAYRNDAFILVGTSASFTISAAAATVTPDAATYGSGVPIVVSWSGLPANQFAWVAVSTAGSASCSFLSFHYTGGLTSGSTSFHLHLAAGSYVARAFTSSCAQAAQTPFSVVSRVSTNAANYAAAPANVIVSWQNAPAGTNTIGLATFGSAVGTFVQSTTSAAASGMVTFSGV